MRLEIIIAQNGYIVTIQDNTGETALFLAATPNELKKIVAEATTGFLNEGNQTPSNDEEVPQNRASRRRK